MWFSNITLLRMQEPVAVPSEDELQEFALRPCGATEMETAGWISPYGRNHEVLLHEQGDYATMALGTEERILPSGVVKDALEEKVIELEAERGKKPGRKERNELKDEITFTLMPKAFTVNKRLSGYMDQRRQLVIVDSRTAKQVERYTNTLRETIGSLPVELVAPAEGISKTLTTWLLDGPPAGFQLGDEVDFFDPANTSAVIRARRQELTDKDILQFAKTGMEVSRLGLRYDERIDFVLDNELGIRRIRYDDVVREGLEDELEFAAVFALQALELGRLVDTLLNSFDS